MSAQSEALRLADALEQDYCSCHEGYKLRNRIDPQCESCQTKDWRNEAAAELRRLHAQRDALLEALKEIQDWTARATARAAIAKVEENKYE